MHSALVAVATLAVATAQAPWAVADMAADLDEIETAVIGTWSYCEDHRQHFGVDVKALIAAAKQELPAAQSADDVARILRRFTSSLQDGHAWCRVPGESPRPERRLPLRLVDCKEGLVVAAVAEGPSYPLRGDVLLEVAGVPVADAIRELEREAWASTPGMRRQLAIDGLLERREERVLCIFERANGSKHEIELATLAPDTPAPGTADTPNWTLAWPRADVAQVRLSSFTVPRWQQWLQAKPEERDAFLAEGRERIDAIVAEVAAKPARALILDVRGNVGGTDLLGIYLAERLLAEPFVFFQLSSLRDDGWRPPGGLTYGKGEHRRYTGPIVALIDERCFSAADNFLRCLDDLHPNITFVGRQTGAGTGAPRELVVTSRCKFVVGACTQRVHGPRGLITEGRGTAPDVAVQWTRADVVAGTDPDLAAAFAAIDGDRKQR